MSDFNLPPGVTTDMIPGNRPEDLRFEYLLEETYNEVQDQLYLSVKPIVELVLARAGLDLPEHEVADLISFYKEDLLK
jgi:hypothetical protein